MYLYLKSLHIIFVVSWFAGLFYLPRLFIYHREAEEKGGDEASILITQFKIMEKRLWRIITWPSCLITFLLGGSLLSAFIPLTNHPWLVLKLVLVLGLFIFHLSCGYFLKQLDQGICQRSSHFFRLWNEIPTLFLFSIVFLVVLKNSLDMLWGLLGLFLLMLTLMLGVKVYRHLRLCKKKQKHYDGKPN